jgi:hypothetical protein
MGLLAGSVMVVLALIGQKYCQLAIAIHATANTANIAK